MLVPERLKSSLLRSNAGVLTLVLRSKRMGFELPQDLDGLMSILDRLLPVSIGAPRRRDLVVLAVAPLSIIPGDTAAW